MDADFRGKNILVTGGTGFIGQHLVNSLSGKGANVTVLSRHGLITPGTEKLRFNVVNGDLTQPATLAEICRGANIVFHLAGHSHALDQADDKNEGVNQRVTVNGTRALVELSLREGVERFIFLSSVKAMGEGGATRIDESSPAVPVSPYGRAKLEAEKLVLDAGRDRPAVPLPLMAPMNRAVSPSPGPAGHPLPRNAGEPVRPAAVGSWAGHGMHVCVLRLPLVYGRDNQGNIPRMVAAVDRGWFPPLPETGNKRSMVHVDDVVQAAQPIVRAGSTNCLLLLFLSLKRFYPAYPNSFHGHMVWHMHPKSETMKRSNSNHILQRVLKGRALRSMGLSL